MKTTIKKQISKMLDVPKHKLIKVQLDFKTFITIWRMSSLKVWQKRYPDAKVISM